MPLSAKLIRKQLELLRPLINASTIEQARRGQDKLGGLMVATRRK